MGKLDEAAGLRRIEQKAEPQRLQRLAHRHDAVDDKAIEETVELGHVVAEEAVVFEDRPHDRGQRAAADTPGQPVSQLPIAAVGPDR